MGEGETERQPITFSRLAEQGTGWLGLSEADFWEMTLHAFNLRLKGWREAREAESLEAWRRTRTLASYTLAIGQWKNGKVPDIYKLMPLPGDPNKEPEFIEISDEDMAKRKYRIKKNYQVNFDEEFEALILKYYQPDWGPHPAELVKKTVNDKR